MAMNVFELFSSISLRDDDYRQSLNAAERATDRTSRDMQRTWDQRLGRMQRSLDQFGSRLRSVGSSMTTRLTLPIAGLGVAIAKVAGDFESSMNRVQAVTNAAAGEMEDMTKLARELGETTQFSASQAAEGMGFLAQAGFDTNEILSALPGTLELAAAGQLELAQAADLASNVLSGFGLEAAEVGRVNDTMAATASSANTSVSQLGNALSFAAPVAAGMGVSVEEAAAAVGMLSNAGIQGERAGTALRGILGQLSQNADELGISMRDAEGNTRPLVEILEQLEAQGFTAQDAIEKLGLEAGPAMQALLSQGSGALRELTGELENAGGTAQRMAEQQMEGLNGALLELKSAAQGLAIAIAESGFIEWLENSVDRLTTFVRHISDMESNTLRTITQIAGALAVGGPLMIGLGAAAGAVSNLIGVMRALRLAMLPFLGAAGVLALLAGWVGFKLVQAWRDNNSAVGDAIEQTHKVREAFDEAGTDVEQLTGVVNGLGDELDENASTAWRGWADEVLKQAKRAEAAGTSIGDLDNTGSLRARLFSLSRELEGDAKQAFINWATQAAASAENVEDVSRVLERAYARINNAAEIASAQQKLTRLEMEQTLAKERQQRFADSPMGPERLEELRQGLQNMIEQDAPERIIQARREMIEMVEQQVQGAMQSNADVQQRIGVQIQEQRRLIQELRGELVELGDVTPEVTVTTNTEPDADVPAADDSDPSGFNTLGDEGVDVEVRTVANAETAEEAFEALARQGTAINQRVAAVPDLMAEGLERKIGLFRSLLERAFDIEGITGPQLDYLQARLEELERRQRVLTRGPIERDPARQQGGPGLPGRIPTANEFGQREGFGVLQENMDRTVEGLEEVGSAFQDTHDPIAEATAEAHKLREGFGVLEEGAGDARDLVEEAGAEFQDTQEKMPPLIESSRDMADGFGTLRENMDLTVQGLEEVGGQFQETHTPIMDAQAAAHELREGMGVLDESVRNSVDGVTTMGNRTAEAGQAFQDTGHSADVALEGFGRLEEGLDRGRDAALDWRTAAMDAVGVQDDITRAVQESREQVDAMIVVWERQAQLETDIAQARLAQQQGGSFPGDTGDGGGTEGGTGEDGESEGDTRIIKGAEGLIAALEKGDTAVGKFVSGLIEATKNVPVINEVLQAFTAEVDKSTGKIAISFSPLEMLANLFASAIGKTKAFQDLIEAGTKALQPFVNAVEPLVSVLADLLTALQPLFEVLAQLTQAALAPLVWTLKNIVVPIFNWVANAIKTVYNALFGWLFGRIEDDNKRLDEKQGTSSGGAGVETKDRPSRPRVDLEDAEALEEQAARNQRLVDNYLQNAEWARENAQAFEPGSRRYEQEMALASEYEAKAKNLQRTVDSMLAKAERIRNEEKEPPPGDGAGDGVGGGSDFTPTSPDFEPTPFEPGDTGGMDRPEVQFGGTPQAVQLAVATPLVEASHNMLEASEIMMSMFGGGDVTGGVAEGAVNFGGHVERFGEYVNRLVDEGILVRTGEASTGGSTGTAHLRGL